MHAVYNVTNRQTPVLLIEWFGTDDLKPGMALSLEAAKALRDSLSVVILAVEKNIVEENKQALPKIKKGISPRHGYAQGKTCKSCGHKHPCYIPDCGDISGFNEWIPKK